MSDVFRKFAERVAHAMGSPWAFLLAIAVVACWGASGPLFGFSDTWQLIINTSTTIVTFLMVFVIQNTQNRDNRIVNLKLDELLRSSKGARTGFVELEHLTDEQLAGVQSEFERLQGRYGGVVDDHLARVKQERETRRQRSDASTDRTDRDKHS